MIKKLLNKHQYAILATDIVIFTIINSELYVLLEECRAKHSEGKWACPGGLLELGEKSEAGAKRHLKRVTGMSNLYMEQICTFADPKRDPSGHIASVGYVIFIPEDKRKEEYKHATWAPVKKLPTLAYDHKQMVKQAVEHVAGRLMTSSIAFAMLPDEFTLTELQETYETYLKKTFDKRNFRKKVMATKLLKKLGKKRKGVANRPAELFSFKKKAADAGALL